VEGEIEESSIHEGVVLLSSLEEEMIDTLDWIEESDFDAANEEIERRVKITERFYSVNFPKILDFLAKKYPTKNIKVDEDNGFIVLSKENEGLLINMCQDEALAVDPMQIDKSWRPFFHVDFFVGDIDTEPVFADRSLICSSFQELKQGFSEWINTLAIRKGSNV